jgi:hypothetical protein
MKLKGIDTTTIDGKIAVMKAYAAGHRIAIRMKPVGPWREAHCPNWHWGDAAYDVIEEPRELYLVEVRIKATDKLYTGYYRTSLESAESLKAEILKNSGSDLYVTITKFVEAE